MRKRDAEKMTESRISNGVWNDIKQLRYRYAYWKQDAKLKKELFDFSCSEIKHHIKQQEQLLDLLHLLKDNIDDKVIVELINKSIEGFHTRNILHSKESY